MDQVKIGKLIAMLRKEKGLTQSELGEKVGVSDGAVSKWERGATCPDISIINTLSKTLGITSDELLTGELSNETRKRISYKKSLKTIIPQLIIFLIVATISVFIIISNNTNVYKLMSESNEYTVKGRVIFNKDKMTIQVDEVVFNDKTLNETLINNYEYKLKCTNNILFKKGKLDAENLLSVATKVVEISREIKIDYSDEYAVEKKTIKDDGLELKITFITENNDVINKIIRIKLTK